MVLGDFERVVLETGVVFWKKVVGGVVCAPEIRRNFGLFPWKKACASGQALHFCFIESPVLESMFSEEEKSKRE